MKWTSTHIFDHSWEMIAQAAGRKYPNPFSTNVTGVDIVDRKVDSKGVLQTHKLLTTDWKLPDIAIKLLGMNNRGYVSEHSEIDAKKETYTLRSRNLSFSNIILIEEKLVYSSHPQDQSKTVLQQEANVTVQTHLPWLTGKIESWIADTMAKNAGKGREGIEWVINKIQIESEELKQSAIHSMDNFLQNNPTL